MPESANTKVLNTHCPWSGKPVSGDSLTRYRDHWVGFCNPGCRDKFDAAIRFFDPLLEKAAQSVSR